MKGSVLRVRVRVREEVRVRIRARARARVRMRAWVEPRAHLEALLLGARDEVLRVTVDLLAWLGLGFGSA